ncbi:MAG: hypothetical protein Q8O33_18370 [Pseudomonadota bacterium]|nr:hypothetical protein [Pseudomonadota bacterium]
MKKMVRLEWMVALMCGMFGGVAHGDSILDFGDSSGGNTVASAPASTEPVLQVNPSRFAFEQFGSIAFPKSGEAPRVYAEFIGVGAFESALRDRLGSRGYKLSDVRESGVAHLQLAADYSADGKFQEVGKISTGNVELGKVLVLSTVPPNKETADSGKRPSALSGIGRDLGANYHSLQLSGGSLAGGFGVQAVVAGLFDLTGLTGLIQRTHAPKNPYSFCAMYSDDCKAKRDALDRPRQVVNVWLNYTSGDGTVHGSSRIEARYDEPALAPVQLSASAFDYALSSIGLGDVLGDEKP